MLGIVQRTGAGQTGIAGIMVDQVDEAVARAAAGKEAEARIQAGAKAAKAAREARAKEAAKAT